MFCQGFYAFVYSYRSRYNGLLASFFLSFRETLLDVLPILSFILAGSFIALARFGLDGFSLQIFSFRVSNVYAYFLSD
jgi:hypothetical protein